MSEPLTDRQAQVLRVIHAHLGEHGRYPTYRELMAVFDMASTQAVVCHLRSLEQKGYIDWRGTAMHYHPIRLRGVRMVPVWDDTPEAARLRAIVEDKA